MTEEEKLQSQKDAVASMKMAQANMGKALDRINALERALSSAASALEDASKQMSGYQYNSTKSMRDKFAESAADARKAL